MRANLEHPPVHLPEEHDSALAAGAQITEQACRQLVQRILSSKDFKKAAKLRAFLSYAVDQKFSGHPQALTEVQIGHRVLGRAENYNPGEDSIVRTQARTLRQKLEQYFQTEGSAEPLLLEFPKGSYAPVFRPRTLPHEPTASPDKPRFNRRRIILLSACCVVLAGIAALLSMPRALNLHALLRNEISFESADPLLDVKVAAARDRALASVHSWSAVGSWYDAPGGNIGFCPRDLAHQSSGAAPLGFALQTRNMITAFAKSISASRDWCGLWEITPRGTPYSLDYTDDRHFRFALPANFDQLQAAYHEYLWTGDETYLKDPALLNFYSRTVNDYVHAWDKDGDGIMESLPAHGNRGIPSYLQHEPRALTGADLIALQYAGYKAYASLLSRMPASQPASMDQKAQALKTTFNQQWWNPSKQQFYAARLADGSFYPDYLSESNIYALLFRLTESGGKTESALNQMEAHTPGNTQMRSYVPQVLFAYGRDSAGYKALLNFFQPEALRQAKDSFEPELAFATITSVVHGLMGISADMPRHLVITRSHLPPELEWAQLKAVSIGLNRINVRHDTEGTSLTNQSGPPVRWKIEFPLPVEPRGIQIFLDNHPLPFSQGVDENGGLIGFAETTVTPGKTREFRLRHQLGAVR
jgi:hypothetical protein